MDCLRIIQFTDTHLISDEGVTLHGVDTYRSLKHCVEKAFILSTSVDAIVVTGDITEDGLEKSYMRFREIFENTQASVYVVPGNHDNRSNMQNIFEGTNIHITNQAHLGEWLLLFCDSQVLGESHGYLPDSELVNIRSLLTKYSEKYALLSLHHSMKFSCPSFGCMLQNEDAVIETLANFKNMRLVISGHVHTEFENKHAHLQLLATPSTFALCHHPSLHHNMDINDFWASHTLDQSKQGFRTLDLLSDGTFKSEIHWL